MNAMEKQEYQTKGCLHLILEESKQIKSFHATEFEFDTSKLKMKSTIFDLFPFSMDGQLNLVNLFMKARTGQKMQTTFSAKGKRFLATVVALKKVEDTTKHVFSVKIKQITGSPKILRDMPDLN